MVVNDPNTRIKQLEGKLKSFQSEWRRVRKLLIEDSDQGEASAERLSDRMQDWLVEWNDEMKPYQDADGYLKEGFKGYSSEFDYSWYGGYPDEPKNGKCE